MRRPVVVDTGLGNIQSVVRALRRSGAEPTVSSDPGIIAKAETLVVPGQGAFRDCAGALASGLGEALREAITRGTPYLGICLGLQILFPSSEEAPGCAGLCVFPGRVVKLRGGPGIKVPHVGWNLVEGKDAPDYFYFVHSYVVVPDDPTLAVATTTHGERFVSAIAKDNVLAVQFHPEKSQRAGLALLERFLR